MSANASDGVDLNELALNWTNNISSSIEMTSMSDISSIDGRYDRWTTVVQTTLIAVISSAIILSNIINLIVLLSASAAMPCATRLFLINLSISDLLVGVVACAPAVLPAATHRWTYRVHIPGQPG